jgi:site-specific recombinase XerD
MGIAVRRSLWRYLAARDNKDDECAPLFRANQRSLNRDSLRDLVARLGGVAQIRKCHPHCLRHTFAITYLRCGGDVFSLQRLLGHGSLEWCSTTPAWPRWTLSRRIAGPVLPTIGGYRQAEDSRVLGG